MTSPVDPPALTLGVDDLVDWLELTAMFDEFGVARIDALLGSLQELEETAEDDIGERDRKREQLIEDIENEVDLRQKHLCDAYPFKLSESGEELSRCDQWLDEQYVFYIICLITTHVSGSAILRRPPVEALLVRLRNYIFQIVATLGLAGLSIGPAFSVGWPRQNGEALVDLLARAAAAGGGFTPRNPPGPYVSPQEKDGGIDVIAFSSDGLPPPTAFYFGQTASGKNWPGKPVSEHARTFGGAYMIDHMTGNMVYVTLIPYRVTNEAFWYAQSQLHRAILERLRLPARALKGLRLAVDGTPVDHFENVADLSRWVGDYLDYAQAA